jgi:hypothetical protein
MMVFTSSRNTREPRQLGRWRIQARVWVALAAVFFSLSALGQYTAPYVGITGTLGSANGMPASNYGITLVPTQVMYVGGTSVVIGNASCATDTNGAVIGTMNPQTPPIVAANLITGTVPIGNYYVEITWYDAFNHQTLPSPEVQVQLTSAGSILVSPPAAGAPLSAVGMKVYIGTSSGAETYQGQVTNPASTYTQSVPLVTGAALPNINGTVCVVVANDAAWPIAGYMFNLTTPAGNNVPGFPQQVQFIGPGSAFNISNGLPLFNGRVTYPVPVITLPYNHNPQSISGPLSMTNYNVYNVGRLGVGTALPAWGVDVEGSGQAAAINANQGYLINGDGGTVGQAPCSDGTYVDQFCTFVTSIPTLYYQTIQANGVDQTQRAKVNFSSFFALSDSSSPSRTNVDAAPSGVTAGSYSCPNASVDAYGRVTAIANGTCFGVQKTWVAQTLCTPATSTDATCSGSYTFPASFAFADTGYGLWIQGLSSTGAGIYAVVTSKSTSSIGYAVWCTFGCSSYGTVTFDVFAVHP